MSEKHPLKRRSVQISFCTTTANRLSQLRKTFASNAEVVASNHNIEWVVLNYGATDGTHEYVMNRLPEVSERVIYAHDVTSPPWHSSKAKNMAHRLGIGSVLMNLDCDNFMDDAPTKILRFFSQGCQLLHLWSGIVSDGTYGRIAIDRELFHKVGGYDESFDPMGFQDVDLMQRARATGVPLLYSKTTPDAAVYNTKEDSVRNCVGKGVTWQDFNSANMLRGLENLAQGILVANRATKWDDTKLIVRSGGVPTPHEHEPARALATA